MAEKDKDKAKVDLGLLEEDDEFEEFPAEGTYPNHSIAQRPNKELSNFEFIFVIVRLDWNQGKRR